MLLPRRTFLSACLCVALSWLVGQSVGHAKSSRRVTRRRPAFRPRLESLEDRLAPATFEWTGATGTNWSDAGNWNVTAGTGTYPGDTSNDDIVKFPAAGVVNDCSLDEDVRVKDLIIDSFFFNTLIVGANHSLTVRAGKFDMQGGRIELGDGSRLNLRSGVHDWSDGNLNTGLVAGNGKIHIYDDGFLRIAGDARQLGATVVVGQNTFGTDSTGTLLFARAGGPQLNNNVTLYRGANIINHRRGAIEFNQTTDSNSKGSIDVEAGQTSKIDNYGLMRRTKVDGQNQTLKIVPPVKGLGEHSVLEVGANCRIEFAGQYIMEEGGLYKPDPTAHVKGFVGKGGKISIQDPGVAGLYDVYFDDSLTVENTTIEFIQSTPGAYGRVHVAGDLVLGAGTTVLLNVDGANEGVSDLFDVVGTVSIDGASLEVTTQAASPPSDYTYAIILSEGDEGAWSGDPVNHGFPAAYTFLSPIELLVL